MKVKYFDLKNKKVFITGGECSRDENLTWGRDRKLAHSSV